MLAANPKLRAVCSMSITPDNIDVAEATKRGIPVTVVPPIVAEATADITLRADACGGAPHDGRRQDGAGRQDSPARSRIISLAFRSTARRSAWSAGAGRIGKAMARRARGFGMRILYWGPRRKDGSRGAGAWHRARYARATCCAESDFVSLHPPLNAETRHMISDKQFALMKPTAFIINTARGADHRREGVDACTEEKADRGRRP